MHSYPQSLLRKLLTFVIVTGALGIFATIVSSQNAEAATGINQQINFQGRLLNAQGAVVPDGYYNIQFKIYQDGDGQSVGNTTGSPAGSLKWTESHLNQAGQGVQVKNGFLSVQLGSVTAFGSSVDWNQDTLWISMNVGNTNASCTPFTSCGADGEMIPMKRLSSTPYAMNAGQLGGRTADGFIQNTTSPQAANIAIQSADAGEVAAIIQGAVAQTADIFQVTAAGTGTPVMAVSATGDVAIQSAANGVSAFAVKNTSSQTVLGVDTLNGRVGIGTGTPSTALHVSVNTATVNSPSLLVEQLGSGDSSLEVRDSSGKSFYLGMDRSNGSSFKIGSSTSVQSSLNVGNTTIGGSSNTALGGSLIAKKVTVGAQGGTLSSISLYASFVDSTSPRVKVALYAHDAANNRPGTLITGSSTGQILSTGWNTIPLSGVVAASTVYWIAVNAEGASGISYEYCGGCGGENAYYSSQPFGSSLPSSAGAPTSTSTNEDYNWYMTVSYGAISDTFSGADLFSMTDTGALTLQNSTNSATAFQIQNAAKTTNVMRADTVNNRIGISLGSSETNNFTLGFGGSSNQTIGVNQRTSAGAGRALTIQAGLGNAGAGGELVLQAGAGSGTNMNGGNVTINAGAKTGTGADGVVTIGSANTSAITLGQNTTVQAGALTVGTAAIAGNVVISDGSSNTATITVGNLAGNYTYSIPVTTANDTICLQTHANCTSTGVTTIGTYSTTNTAAGGATITGNEIIFQDASGTAPGMVGIGTQTFAGDKTFSGNINTTSQYQLGGSNLLSGSALTFTAASANSVQAANNQALTVQGGTATTSNTNGGSLTIAGGAGNGTGVKGLVNIGPSAQTAVTNTACAADCTIDQANVDGYGTIIISASASDIVITLPAPTTATQGRTVYVTTAAGSQDFTLRTNSGLNLIDVAMRQNTTSTMIWNGTAWTPGGASNATTLQATYNNGSNPSTTPEIKLDAIRGTIDIQDADTTIGSDILNIRGSNASALGTVLFGVSNTGRVTIQGTTDQSSAFRVLGSNGDYLFNINSANSYVISNATRAPGNEISNPSLESGGEITSGEEGWFGPATVSIENSAANSRVGNHYLQITANSSNIDAYAGKYYEVIAGEMLFFEGWVKNSAGANGNAGIQITWFDKDKAVLSYSTAYPNTPGTSYVQRTVSGLAPANAHYARVSATVRSNSTTGTFYFDNFYMKRSIESADMTFRNSTDSSTAFRIQSAGAAQTIFTANTTNNTVKIGDNAGTGANTTLLVLDSATSDPSTLTGLDGGIFYRSDNNSLKAVIGGAVVDICTTAVTCSGYSASAGSAIALQGSTPGTQQVGNFNISGTGILTAIKTMDNASGSSQALSIRTGNATGGNSGSLTIDVGTATGTKGTITIGSAGVATTMPGTLAIQGSNSLTLGSSSSASGSILFRTSAGANTVTISAPAANPTASYNLVLPTSLGAAGECLKTDASGNTYFQGCGVGVNFNLQDAYNNSGTPAEIVLADGKNFLFTAQDTSGIEPSVLINLACTVGCTGTDGRFSVQNGGVDVFTVSPNGAGITLARETQIGSSTTDSTQILFQLDSYNGSSDDPAQGCSTTVNQGAMYYNTSMGSIRSCINGSWSDVSNPDTLGLLTFGIVPSSGSQPYDLPSLVTNGYSGPCKVSWASTTSVHIEACTAYSNGRRLSVAATNLSTNTATSPNTNLTTGARWGHVCLDPLSGQPEFTSTTGTATPTDNMPAFSAANPILCLADVVGSGTTGGTIDDIYDVRTFTSAMKEAVNLSSATQLGMTVDAGTGGAMTPATAGSAKLYGTVVSTDGGTSAGAPNAIITTVGPAWVKATAGTAGQFVKSNTPAGYSNTTASIPNNSFYYSVGNTRTSWSSTCTASSNCAGSLYVNFIVR